MNTTKQKTRYSIELPEAVVNVLAWHVETQLGSPLRERSDLLFPSITGGFRTPTVLNKPFAEVPEAMQLGYAESYRLKEAKELNKSRAARRKTKRS